MANPTIREQSFHLDSCLSKKKIIKEKSSSHWGEPYEIANSLPFLTYKNVNFISSPNRTVFESYSQLDHKGV